MSDQLSRIENAVAQLRSAIKLQAQLNRIEALLKQILEEASDGLKQEALTIAAQLKQQTDELKKDVSDNTPTT